MKLILLLELIQLAMSAHRNSCHLWRRCAQAAPGLCNRLPAIKVDANDRQGKAANGMDSRCQIAAPSTVNPAEFHRGQHQFSPNPSLSPRVIVV
jgi:hypothetical protein